MTPEQQAICENLFAESRARSFTSDQKALLHDGEIRRYWPETDVEMFTLGKEFLRQREYVNDPLVDGVAHKGLWRCAFIEVQQDPDETPRLVEVLREGYAPFLFDQECRNVSNKEYKDLEEVALLRWKNLDPNEARVIREQLLARDLSATAALPDVNSRAGIGELTVKEDAYGADYEIAAAELTWDEDGSAIIDLILVKTNGESLEFTVGLSCGRTMVIYYGYGLAKDDLSAWKQAKNLHVNEDGKLKDFRVLRRNQEKGTFDVFGSVTTFSERNLEEHLSEISAGRAVYSRSNLDADAVSTITLASGEIVRLQARKNDRCLIDEDIDRIVPNDLPRTTGMDQVKKSSSGEEHFEASSLDTTALEATEANPNELIEWFWKKTDADNYAWSLRTITYEKLPGWEKRETHAHSLDASKVRNDLEEPAYPVALPVGEIWQLEKNCNELGSWDWNRTVTTAKPMDSDWIQLWTTDGWVYVRVLRNQTKAFIESVLAEWTGQSYNVSARPRYNDDGTMEVTVVATPDKTTGSVETTTQIQYHLPQPHATFNKWEVYTIITRRASKAEDFMLGPGHDAWPERKDFIVPNNYERVAGCPYAKSGVTSVAGGKWKAILVYGTKEDKAAKQGGSPTTK